MCRLTCRLPIDRRVGTGWFPGLMNMSGQKYRAYIVGPDGHFKSAEIVESVDDVAAIELAKKYVGEGGMELWLLDRQVAILRSESDI